MEVQKIPFLSKFFLRPAFFQYTDRCTEKKAGGKKNTDAKMNPPELFFLDQPETMGE